MDRIYRRLVEAGHIRNGMDWLRRHRPGPIVTLALGAWSATIVLGWLAWAVLV